MPTSIYKSAFTSAVLAGMLMSCSDIETQPDNPVKESMEGQFSVEEKRIAQTLSISNSAAAQKNNGPYDQALFCSLTIGKLLERLREFESVNSEIVEAGDQAKVIFDRRLKDIATKEGKSAADIQSDFNLAASENTDPSENARSALACLQRLQLT